MANEKKREVFSWMKKADEDLRGAQVVMEAKPALIETALFHCQQAAEKAMKAFLTAHDMPFRKTHDLDELAVACEKIDASLKDVLDPARDLTVFAWEFRCPGSSSTPSEAESYDAIALAEAVILAVRKHLANMAE